MLLGVLAGVLAGALWGLAFIAPVEVLPFTPFDLTILRTFVFGVLSLIILAMDKFSAVRRLTLKDTCLLVVLGFTGHCGFYLALSLGVDFVGVTMMTTTIGCLPVVFSLIANRANIAHHGWQILGPISCVAMGLLIVDGTIFFRAPPTLPLDAFSKGLALAIVAILMWCYYGLRNSREISLRPWLSSMNWTALTGLGAFISLVLAWPLGEVAHLSAMPNTEITHADSVRFLMWGSAIGGASSLGATWAWSIAAKRLPVAVAAQLIVSETVFGLFYSAVAQRVMPSVSVIIGSFVLLLGVTQALKRLHSTVVA